jgi:hypothetical protein
MTGQGALRSLHFSKPQQTNFTVEVIEPLVFNTICASLLSSS